MLTKIIAFSVKNKLIIGLFVIGLLVYGSYEAARLPIDAVPDITNNQVQVITVAPALGATDIERLITFPIEQANSNIAGITEIRSFSRFGLSLVTIVFNDATDVYWARQQVAERLQQVQTVIPPGTGVPELGPISTGLGEIYQYVVRPKPGYEHRFDAIELRTIQDWIVRRQLLGVKGVAEVSSFGGKLKQYEIAVSSQRLNAYSISINDVFNALENNNQNTGGAYIEKGPTVLYIRSEGLIGNIQDIENITVKQTTSGTPIYIRDVADVKIGYATRYGAMTYNDQGEVSGAVVMMLKGANSSEVIKNVKERIAQIRKTLPEGVMIEPFLDRTKMVNNAISTVETNLLEGALIVVFVLVVFLGNFRAGLLVASVIPLAMLFAIIMMNLFGVSGNLMSLGALDFGLIVDGAVIIVEAVMHRLSHSKRFANTNKLSKHQMNDEVTGAASKMMNSAVFGQIIILIVYLPIFSLEGIEGKMFKPMAQTVAFALLGAFILSLTYIPMMSSFFLSKKIKHTKNWSDKIMEKAERLYQHALDFNLRNKKLVVSAIAVMFIFSIIVLSRLGGEFIPSLEEGDFAVDTRVLSGSNLNSTIEYTQKAAHILKTRFPEVQKIVTKIGSGEVPTDPMPMEASDMMVILKDKKEWTSAKTFNELSEKMSEALQDVPGITASFQYPVQMRFNELMTGARQDVVLKIFGENLDTLASQVQKLGKIIGEVNGVQNLYVETVTGMPQIIIEYNRPVIAQYSLSVADINRAVNTAFAGQSAGQVFEEEKRFDMVVRLDAKEKKNLTDVQNLLIPTPMGLQIPLEQLATVSVKEGPNQIQREDAKRRIIAGFNVRNRDVETVVKELQQRVEEKLKLPAGYYVTYGGSFENLKKAKARLMLAVPIALLLIFLLLYFAFNSIKQSLLIYSAIPLSAIGGILFLALRGMPFSVSAGVGFIALFGIAVLNGIVLIAEFNQLKKEGMTDLKRIVLMGTKIRLRPVLMTAFVASLGFLPMALSNGAGAEVQRPLATVVIGGLMIATILTLGILPVLYVMFESAGKKKINPSAALVLVFCLVAAFTNAQSTIGLPAAVDSALKNNLQLNSEKLRAEYARVLIRSSAVVSPTDIITDAGQLNSAFFDTKISAAQTFNFPAVYLKQKHLFTQEWKSSLLSISAKEAEIKKALSEIFLNYAFLKQKQELLLQTDSLYSKLLQKAALRLQKGESNVLEKASFETQKTSTDIQLKQLQQEMETVLLQFNLLLNTAGLYEPAIAGFKKMELSLPGADAVFNHASLRVLAHQQAVAEASTAVEKSKLLPQFILGYSNTSMMGTGADDKQYGAAHRFHTAQVGLSVPIFTAAQKTRVKAGKINEQLQKNIYESGKQILQNRLHTALAQYTRNLEIVLAYEDKYLLNAALIKETAGRQFANGEINYLDFVMLVNQSVIVQGGYLDALLQLNSNVVLINYLSSK
ncbi:MAG: CusA/CzcA family heavy metal efflux RND transporter [Ferruginibacter sp.]